MKPPAPFAAPRIKHFYHVAKPRSEQVAPAQDCEAVEIVHVVRRNGVVKVIHILVSRANIARPICAAMLGKHHSPVHRMAAGVVVMAVGVACAKFFGHMPSSTVAFIGDAVGYGLHGLGLTPFIEHLAEKFRDDD
jgi:hypothetical protein